MKRRSLLEISAVAWCFRRHSIPSAWSSPRGGEGIARRVIQEIWGGEPCRGRTPPRLVAGDGSATKHATNSSVNKPLNNG